MREAAFLVGLVMDPDASWLLTRSTTQFRRDNHQKHRAFASSSAPAFSRRHWMHIQGDALRGPLALDGGAGNRRKAMR